jgi:triacylglycerol lipase
MISRWFRCALGLQAFVLLATIGLLRGRLTPGVAIAAGATVVVLNFCVVAAVYLVLRLYVGRRSRAGGAGAWRCALTEISALFAVFVVIQPFERWWVGVETVGPVAAGRTPVLLVHGYLCNRGLWWWLRRRLRARRHAVATINLEPPLANIDRLAEQLDRRIEALLAETGAERVTLVTHSMGGLASRAYLRRRGGARVAGLITLAAPHNGTRIARLGLGRNAREMAPDSDWLQELNSEPTSSVPIANLWSVDDEVIDPPDASRLADAREFILRGVGHIAMAFSPTVLARVDAELTRD